MNQGTDIKNIMIDMQKLPLVLEFDSKGTKKQYVLKTNKDRTGIFLNKKENY